MPEAPIPRDTPQPTPAPDARVDYSPSLGEAVKTTTCYMCACRCGIKVHLKSGEIRYIEGNPDHPVNRGVLCGKGSAGIMTQYAPARLRAPLKRVGPRGSGEFVEIGWDEALATAAAWLGEVRARDPKRLAFFTGRDQSQSLTGFWAAQFGTPNFAAHGGFCSVNMAAAGQYTIGGSFWEFGEPDWDRAKYMLMFGVAEDHDSNPIKIGLTKLKARGAKFVSVNPVRTGYSAIADEWVGIRPGTDGLFVGALIHELLRTDRVDADYLARYTNAAWLVVQAPGTAGDGLFARDADGAKLVWDPAHGALPVGAAQSDAVLAGDRTLPDGTRVRPVFHLLAERYLAPEFAPEVVAATCGLDAADIRRIAAELAAAAFDDPVVIEQPWTDTFGVRHPRMVGRGVAMHAMRGISAHANGFHTCRAIHILQMLLGAVDTPGSWRYKSPYPRPIPPGPPPAGRDAVTAGEPLKGNLLGFPLGPEDLLLDEAGQALRIDKAFSWDAPLAVHGMLHTVIANAAAGDPYTIDVLFLFMANMAWNSAMNPGEVVRCLTETREDGEYVIPKVIYSDAYWSETVPYADLILPDTTFLERWDCISLLDRPIGNAHGPGDGIRQPVLTPDRDVRPFQDVLIDLGARLQLPAFSHLDGSAKYRDYADYIVKHERSPGIGPLAGWRGVDGAAHGVGAPNPSQLDRYIANGCFWKHELPLEQQYFKHANQAYLDGAKAMGLVPKADPIVLQIYAEPLQRFRLAAQGHGERQPPEHLRARLLAHCDPLPVWHAPPAADQDTEFPLSAITQRPMAHYHSWGSMNAWLRQVIGENRLYMARSRGASLGLADGDWVQVDSPSGQLRCRVALMAGVNPDTVWTWNAIGKRSGTWGLDPDTTESTRGFLLNHVISEWLPSQGGPRLANADPVTGQAAWYDLRVRVTKCAAPATTEPHPPTLPAQPHAPATRDVLQYQAGARR